MELIGKAEAVERRVEDVELDWFGAVLIWWLSWLAGVWSSCERRSPGGKWK